MKVVIFAGGKGTRLAEETGMRPKPMVNIGGKPIIWHIMKMYGCYGLNDFVICLGYKGYMIKEWFKNYFLHNADVTIDLATNNITVHNRKSENWKVTLVDTGLETFTGTRLSLVEDFVDGEFMLTYGDGLSNVDLGELLAFHRRHGKIATVTAVKPEGRFGSMRLSNQDGVESFAEKIDSEVSWINGGFFVLKPEVFSFLPDKNVMWEQDPLNALSASGELIAYRHNGFWKPMDMLRDKLQLEALWKSGSAPWKIWND